MSDKIYRAQRWENENNIIIFVQRHVQRGILNVICNPDETTDVQIPALLFAGSHAYNSVPEHDAAPLVSFKSLPNPYHFCDTNPRDVT